MSYLKVVLFISVVLFCGSFTSEDATHAPGISETTAQISPAVGLNLGNQAPELIYRNPQGAEIKLSSLRGKLVLIDFWASWCGPCRMENPTVVNAYNTYKDKTFKGGKGFTIYSVSLDGNMDAWKNAIAKDKLSWDYHVSDLKGWSSGAAAQYGIMSIPENYLIDERGVIIKKSLRGADLLSTLEKLVIK